MSVSYTHLILDNTLNTQTVLLDYKHTIVDKICSEAVALNNYIKWYLAVRVSFKKLIKPKIFIVMRYSDHVQNLSHSMTISMNSIR